MDREKIKLIVADVDGTLTDGGMYVSDSGEEFKKYNTKDGMGFKILIKQGYQVGVISASHSKNTVLKRAEILGMQYYYVGNENKTLVLERWMQELGIGYESVAYVGDDINDLDVIEKAGFTACPADAVEIVKERVDVVLQKKGGEGCFREMVDRYFYLKPE
jgi:YrbI family 3-deoxy-D-manno-octulosonate 8-phosphate phosphatase